MLKTYLLQFLHDRHLEYTDTMVSQLEQLVAINILPYFSEEDLTQAEKLADADIRDYLLQKIPELESIIEEECKKVAGVAH